MQESPDDSLWTDLVSAFFVDEGSGTTLTDINSEYTASIALSAFSDSEWSQNGYILKRLQAITATDTISTSDALVGASDCTVCVRIKYDSAWFSNESVPKDYEAVFNLIGLITVNGLDPSSVICGTALSIENTDGFFDIFITSDGSTYIKYYNGTSYVGQESHTGRAISAILKSESYYLIGSYQDTGAEIAVILTWDRILTESEIEEIVTNNFTPQITKPTISATDGAYSAKVVVTASSPTGADTWNFYKNTEDEFSTSSLLASASTNEYEDSNIVPSTLYYYWVQCEGQDYAISVVSNSDSGYAVFSGGENTEGSDDETSGVPHLTVYGETKATLLWTPIYGATSYNLYKGTASGEETLFQEGIEDITYIDTDVVEGTTYFYTVTAVGEADESDQSNEVSIKIRVQYGEYSGRGIDVRRTRLMYKVGRPMKERF